MSESLSNPDTKLQAQTAPEAAPAPEGQPAPQSGQQPEPTPQPAPADWKASLPEGWADRLGDCASAEDALAALERGLGYSPALKPEDVSLKYPEGIEVDEGVSNNFKKFCVDKGITPAQAQALLDWQLAANKEITDAVMARGQQELQKAWGSRFEENRATALKAVVALDRRMGGRLAEAMAFGGQNNNPVMVEAFYHIGQLMSEDALSGGNPAAPADQRESAEDTFKGMFK